MKKDGSINTQGNVDGTYFHGLFSNDHFRKAWLTQLGTVNKDNFNYNASIACALNQLADELEKSINIEALFNIAN